MKLSEKAAIAKAPWISFGPDQVRALLNLRPGYYAEAMDPTEPIKWQMRVPIDPQPMIAVRNPSGLYWQLQSFDNEFMAKWPDMHGPFGLEEQIAEKFSKFGQVGNFIRVREAWRSIPTKVCKIEQRTVNPRIPDICAVYQADLLDTWPHWKEAALMPEWACRLVLEIVNIRVERLMFMTPADCNAEGFYGVREFLDAFMENYPQNLPQCDNPWVLVYEFVRRELHAI